MKPMEVVRSLVPVLTDKERAELREALVGQEVAVELVKEKGSQVVPACDRLGHSFSLAVKVQPTFWQRGYVRLFCRRCATSVTTNL